MKELLTKENKEALEAELKELSGPKRREIISAVEYAKSLGDLSENAEYHAAREAQGKLEDRIAQIEYTLKHAEIVEKPSDGSVAVGCTVTIKKVGETNTRVFQIVGSEETDMLSGKISYKSPIGQALHGKKKGDIVSVITPKGETQYEIISVS
ncbi:MAG: transcription elongation factor GreA [Patescibacteria group bacterium]|jgi:transcription elongation factor GreA|nr:transcription elongation factor GreA [Patescibacteria group bacterium]